MSWIPLRRRTRGRPAHPDVLTPAEWRVLEHVREGMPNAEIATRLGLSVNTVRYHVSNMLAKLDLDNRHDLAAWDGRPRVAVEEPAGGRRLRLGLPLWGWLTGHAGVVAASAAVVVVAAAGVVVIAGLNTVLNAVEEEAPRAPSSNVPATPAATGSAAPAVGAFEPAAEPEFPRTFHTATLLRDGTVLVVGGCCDGSNLIGTAERYDPATDTWSRAGELVVPRQTHTATQLSDGRVVIIGGTGGGGASGILAAIEVYDPATAQFSIAGSLNTARLAHAALALPDDRVLVLGGVGLGDAPQDVELFDPVAVDAEVLGVVLPPPFQQSSAVLLDEGTVLLTGGGSAAVLDLVTHHFEELAAPEELGEWPIAAVALQSGKVLLAGGCCAGTDARPHAAVFDPATRLARPIAPMADGRLAQRMTLLADGRVLVTGGYENAGHGFGDALASAEVFDPATEAFTSTGSMSDHRGSGHTSTLLRDGSVLVVGTITQAGGRAAERYVP